MTYVKERETNETNVISDASGFLKEMLEKSIENIRNDVSLLGRPAKVKVVKEDINKTNIDLEYCVMSHDELIKTYKIQSEGILLPYYFVEVIKIVLASYWSGTYMTKKDKKRYLFLMEYGDSNKHYLNVNLKRVKTLRNIFTLKFIKNKNKKH